MVRPPIVVLALGLFAGLLATPAPAAPAGPVFQGDPQTVAEVRAAFERFGALRTYRSRMTTPGREGAVVIEFVAPDRFRMQLSSAGQPTEIFMIGTEVWMRTGTACQKLPAAMPGTFNPREVDPNAAQGTITVSRGGPEAVQGTPTQTYAMEVAVQGTLVRQKLYVATGSGLPIRVETASPQGPPAVIDYYDFNAPITINNPPC